MSRISATGVTTSQGLVSGIPIEDTVDQLMQLAARPRNELQTRNDGLRAEQQAVDQLSVRVLGLQGSLSTLNRVSTFSSRSASSSSQSVSASVASGATPAVGSYRFTPLRSAAASQVISTSLPELGDSLGSGTFDLRVGGQLDTSARLADLNNGTGFVPGRLRITDRFGETATIDLRGATTVDDVLEAINTSEELDVTASTSGDRIVLTDNSGGTGTFRVREFAGGTTAASLGLAGLSADGDTLTGGDVYGVGPTTRLETLNDGLGVWTSESGVDDLSITARDGEAFGVDLADVDTLSDVISAINDADGNDGRVVASITDGERLTLTDTTVTTGGELTVRAGVAGSAAADLGLLSDRDASETTITGGRLVAGLKDTLLSSLSGGAGVAAGSISITNRAGDPATDIDLSSAETLGEVIDAINAADAGVEARLSDTRGGIVLTDTTGGAGSLVIADVSSTTTAADLGIAVDAEVASIDSGSLDRQTRGLGTRLSDIGDGVALGRIRITDSAGVGSTIDLRFANRDEPTLGDVIDEINAAAIGVTASLNSRGDGLLLTDTADGPGTLTVAESGTTTAADLRLLGASTGEDAEGRQTLDGGTSLSLDLASLAGVGVEAALASLNGGDGVDADGVFQITDSAGATDTVSLNGAATLEDVIDRINASSVSVTAELTSSGAAMRLTDSSGGSGSLVVEDLGTGSAAADLGIVGDASAGGGADAVLTGSAILEDGEPIEQLAARINSAGVGVTASVVFDGVGHRLALASDESGAGRDLLVSAGDSTLGFTETARGSDAVAQFGSDQAGGFLVTSDDGRYDDVIDGVTLTANSADGEEAVIDVTADDQPIIDAVQSFVNAYNGIRTELDTLSSFDPDTLTTGLLFGRSEALRVDIDLARLASGRFAVGGQYNSLESIGVSLNDDGTLSLDSAALSEAIADDRSAVENLLTDETGGVVAQFSEATDSLAGADNSLLSSRSDSLQATIDNNTRRIADWDGRLERQRESLLLEYIRLEETIAELQGNLGYLDSIQPIQISTSNSNN